MTEAPSQKAVSLTFIMSDLDFEHLAVTSTYARFFEEEVLQDRFQTIDESPVNPRLEFVYWLGTEYTAVLFGREFLMSSGFPAQVAWDQAIYDDGSPLGWVIFTDYRSASWFDSNGDER